MIIIVFWFIVLAASLAALIKGSDWFVEGAEELGVKFKMPSFVIGVVIVSIGTSIPELASSIVAVITGNSSIVLANIIGSNIANTLFVLGLGALVAGGLSTKWHLEKVDLPILMASTFLLTLAIMDRSFGWIKGIFFLVCFGIYLNYIKNSQSENLKVGAEYRGIKTIVILILGLAFVILGSNYLIKSAVFIAAFLGVSKAVIGASVIAFGTSVPEAMVTTVAALKGKKEIAFGNVLGSNIFNILFITGVSSFFGKLSVDPSMVNFGLPVLIGSVFMLWITTQERKVTKWEGAMLLVLYGFFILKLFA